MSMGHSIPLNFFGWIIAILAVIANHTKMCRNNHLTSCPELADHGSLYCMVYICAVKHNKWCITSEFQGYPFYCRSRLFQQNLQLERCQRGKEIPNEKSQPHQQF